MNLGSSGVLLPAFLLAAPLVLALLDFTQIRPSSHITGPVSTQT